MKVKISASDIQFDNQLYSKESYDFPVVLIGQEDDKPRIKLSSLNIPIENLIENTDNSALFIINITLETWRDQSRAKDITGTRYSLFR